MLRSRPFFRVHEAHVPIKGSEESCCKVISFPSTQLSLVPVLLLLVNLLQSCAPPHARWKISHSSRLWRQLHSRPFAGDTGLSAGAGPPCRASIALGRPEQDGFRDSAAASSCSLSLITRMHIRCRVLRRHSRMIFLKPKLDHILSSLKIFH